MSFSLFKLRLKKLKYTLLSRRLRKILIKYFVFAGLEHRGLFKIIRPKTIVDIGANRGQFSLIANDLTDAVIYAFEPQVGPAKVFRKIFSLSDKVKLFNVAISDSPGRSCIYISERDDSSSLLPITSLQSDSFPNTGEVARSVVDAGKLDEYLEPSQIESPSLLKIDVQGCEGNVLLGSEKLLKKFDYIYCECSFLEFYEGQILAPDLIHWLLLRGFELHSIFNPLNDIDEKVMQADFLFKKITDEDTCLRN